MSRSTIVPGDGDPRHGTVNGRINLGCYCDPCRVADREESQRYYRNVVLVRRQARDPYRLMVQADAVRRHILRLRAEGVSDDLISKHSGIARSVISKCRTGTSKRVHGHTADKILRVRSSTLAGADRVSVTVTRRKVRSMIALGHTREWIAKTSGLSWTTISDIERSDGKAKVCQHTIEMIDKVLDQAGVFVVHEKRAATARAKGYQPPVWYDADWQPPREPLVLDAERRGQHAYTDHVVEDAAWLIRGGMTLERVSEKLRMDPESIQHAFRKRGLNAPQRGVA